MFKRIFAVFVARNREFVRDRSSLAWNLLLPVALVFGLSYAFDGQRDEYTVGVLQAEAEIDTSAHPFLETRHVRFVPYENIEDAMLKVERHQLDLLVEVGPPTRYWINPTATKGYFVEFALLQSVSTATSNVIKEQVAGKPVRYADWILPGILGMNMMFSCLFGVGYVIVRYRKNGFLKRLRATPLTSLEFITAQVASRMVLIMLITTVCVHWHASAARHAHGRQLHHVVCRGPRGSDLDDLTRAGGIGARDQRGTRRRPPQPDQLANDDAIGRLVFTRGHR